MPTDAAKHETVLDAGTTQSRLARVYAEAFLAAALTESPQRPEEAGAELNDFVRAISAKPAIATFLVSPVVGKKAKAAALEPALGAGASKLLRGLMSTLTQNNRLSLLGSINAAFQKMLEERSHRVPVKVTTAVPLNDDERSTLFAKLKSLLNQEPVPALHVDPDLLGGMVVQVGDSVIDTSVRSRLQTLRGLLLEQ